MDTFLIDEVVLGRYRILSELGSGGMATVYRAFDAERSSEVALKVLNADQLTVPRRLERFHQEFEILSALHHPNIVQVHEVHHTDSGCPFMSMECVEGQSLAQVMAKKSDGSPDAGIDFALALLLTLAKTLQYVHEQGFIYCDLKPQNILVTSSDGIPIPESAKLVDFGIARVIKDEAARPNDVQVVGTTPYMAPEQVRRSRLDNRADIYSFGILAFELLAGRRPFLESGAPSSHAQEVAAHLMAKVPSVRRYNRSVPMKLDLLIQVCLQKNPAARFESMREIVERLKAMRNCASVFFRLRRLWQASFGKG